MVELGTEDRDRVVERPVRRIGSGFRVGRVLRGGWRPLAIAIVIFAALYYPVGVLMIHVIDDDLDYRAEPSDVPEGGSHVVATMAALIWREVETHRWTPNDPWFVPSAAMDNMPNFQLGMISAMSRFSIELADQIGRVRGSSAADDNLQRASGGLKVSGTRWTWDPSVSIWPVASAESEFLAARRNLVEYNARLAAGSAIFDRRVDNLLVAIDRIANDLGASSQAIDDHVREHAGRWRVDFKVDDEFYRIKGQSYAYYLILRDLGRDFDNVLAERNLALPWTEMLAVLRQTAGLDPLVVLNGSPDGLIFPSHLASQGFYLMRARTKLREISNILLK
ncbi:MAG: DUF2333 family protein [Pseudomonadota bacterium]|nr:DUF2333 family protein [Pseudomonadota bacterium]